MVHPNLLNPSHSEDHSTEQRLLSSKIEWALLWPCTLHRTSLGLGVPSPIPVISTRILHVSESLFLLLKHNIQHLEEERFILLSLRFAEGTVHGQLLQGKGGMAQGPVGRELLTAWETECRVKGGSQRQMDPALKLISLEEGSCHTVQISPCDCSSQLFLGAHASPPVAVHWNKGNLQTLGPAGHWLLVGTDSKRPQMLRGSTIQSGSSQRLGISVSFVQVHLTMDTGWMNG